MNQEHELLSPVDLCLSNGRLNRAAVGWSRQPLHRCNLNGRWPRKKRWNYWAITTETHLFSVTVTNLDYAGLVFVYYADFTTGELSETTKLIPFGRGCHLPDNVGDDVQFSSAGVQVAMQNTGDGVSLSVDIADYDGQPLSARFDVTMPPQHESLNVVVPWDDRRFQFTSKQNTLPTEGIVTIGGRETHFTGSQSFACLDLGRGIWPRDSRWNWGSASGEQNGRLIGLNLGGQWTDGTGSTENGVCVNGRLSKISSTLAWQYDKANYMRPWHIADPATAIDLTFTPFMERVAVSNLWLIRSEVHQLFGHYDGHITTSDGEIIPIHNLVGWAEDHVAHW